MTEILARIDRELGDVYESSELDAVKKALCMELLGISALTFYMKEHLSLELQQELKLTQALHRLAQGEPLQYVMGMTPFCELSFKVNSHVLVPRPETAELVEWIIHNHIDTMNGSLLDIGTGSGCIAITIAHNKPEWSVVGYDISEEALRVARHNNSLNKTHVLFKQIDILKTQERDGEYDVIVSNPPYVMESEREKMEDRVLNWEPASALFVPDDDPLLFYSAIIEFAQNNLRPAGCLYFEINPLQANELCTLLEQNHFHDIELRKDIYGKKRMIKAIL